MAVMLSELYDALRPAGTSEEQARKAAEAVASYESRLSSMDGKLSLLQWMLGFNLALPAAIAVKLLVQT
jgi:hypothetical protein